MRVIRNIQKAVRFRHPSCLTIGTFDGVHIGHQAVIGRLVHKATREGLTSVVMTFDPHPLISLRKGCSPPLLTCTQHKLRLLESLGVNVCLLVELDSALAATAPTDFVVEVFCGKLGVGGLVVGPRLRFGKGRKGTLGLLKRLGPKLGFWIEVVEEVIVDGIPVSSTIVRQRVLQGDLPGSEALLGRPFSVLGQVVRGRTIGRKLGYRTANVQLLDQVVPPPGVYGVEVIINGQTHPGALNLGWRPTFPSQNLTSPVLEVHILDFDEPIYRKQVEIVFHRRIRDERQFATAEDLARQIALDIEAVREYSHRRIDAASPR
ncbi:riboflavin biosynthesis protein RibF [bacterium]|nr:riboflavin biosynthesis protein RibF [bacterium]